MGRRKSSVTSGAGRPEKAWYLTLRAFVIAAILVWSGCSVNPPIIESVDWVLEYRTSSADEPLRPYLRVFLRVSDEDGFADLDKLYLINDRTDTYWEAGHGDFLETGAELELAVEFMAAADEDIPSGSYRIILVDSAGERDESTLFVSVTKPDETFASRVRVGANGLTYSGPGTAVVFAYDDSGKVVNQLETSGGAEVVTWETLQTPQARQWSLRYRDDAGGVDYRYGPVDF